MAEKEYTREELLLAAARLRDRFGPQLQPILDRAEREYDLEQQAKQTTESAVDRVKRKLAEHEVKSRDAEE